MIFWEVKLKIIAVLAKDKKLQKECVKVNIQHINTSLSPSDMQQFLQALSQRNQSSFLPVGTEFIKSVQRMPSQDFVCQLITGDSMTVQPVNMVAASNTAISNEEGQQAIQLLKAKKYLNEKGVNVTGLSESDLVDTADLIRSVNNEPLISSGVTGADEHIVNEFKQHFTEMATARKDDDELVNELKALW